MFASPHDGSDRERRFQWHKLISVGTFAGAALSGFFSGVFYTVGVASIKPEYLGGLWSPLKPFVENGAVQVIVILAAPFAAAMVYFRHCLVSADIQLDAIAAGKVPSIERLEKTLAMIADQRIEVIDLRNSNPFAGFTGQTFYALNAPLKWERFNQVDALRTHCDRYRQNSVERGVYVYPNLALFDGDSLREFILPIREFFAMLHQDRRMTRPMRAKLLFVVPRPNSLEVARRKCRSFAMTYFAGQQRGRNTVVYYQLNAIFLEDGIPRWAFHLDDDDFFHRAEQQCKNFLEDTLTMDKLDLQQFLDRLGRIEAAGSYCE